MKYRDRFMELNIVFEWKFIHCKNLIYVSLIYFVNFTLRVYLY